MKSVNKVINIMVKNCHKVSKFESKLADEKKHFQGIPCVKPLDYLRLFCCSKAL